MRTREYCRHTPYPRDIKSILYHVVNVEDELNHWAPHKPDRNIRRINRDILRKRKTKPTLASLYVLFRSALTI